MRGRQLATGFTVVLLVVSLLVAPTAGAPRYGLTPAQFAELSEQVLSGTDPADEPQAADESEWTARRLAELRAERARNRGVERIGAARVHESGITGEGVRIGVIDGGFQSSHAAIAAQVADHRRFESGDARGRLLTAHGTAVAELVGETAPGSDLYLAEVGQSPTPEGYAAAVSWLLDRDVDVIVDSGSYFTDSDAEARAITAVAENASRQGVVFVTSAGNYGDRHWSGSGAVAGNASADSGWVAVADDTEANFLGGGEPIRGEVSLRLRWDGEADYDLYLYRHLERGSPRVVAKSTRRQANESVDNTESLGVAVPPGTYYAAVYAHDANASARLQLFSIHQSLSYADARGSLVAPASSREVIAVGATGPAGAARGYSSVGLTRGDVDVAAPDGVQTHSTGRFTGTSAAAPYVAGTAALIEAREPGLSPTQIEAIIEGTARGGTNVDAYAAVQAASTEREAERATTRPRAQNATG
jgi:subtilisin family serine protease